MISTIKKATIVIAFVLLFAWAIYVSYWLVKTISYLVFYENMVIQSIAQQVKPSCLITGDDE